ncbi:TonB-dependent receptor [Elizabethkingia miricola]|jgi:outer membrane receptor protein involved in Fe transport|uniref:TonB-dependent receptor n=1 Tax=Elizabethkingia miricola TaxID=172045 RepID=A0AAP1BT57_ELIMR|nr:MULTISPECIES: TonB-dependent receptor [Elizabethkingia]KUY17520.1 TonB-dependent receptor [Elizabethkingia miricola]MCL1652709.1 TonB-dependent receptor [Elizabethkingia miricola]OPC29942.1 TonB-dependent receptor [Elizabethkingia miricola]OPC68577.1 TonB-dependent receptor [Elizabethkingia miricola]OPC75689.1 TonB-dependent receptor [Elizabethkingia miricola]
MQKKILAFSLFLSLVFINSLFAQVASVTISGIVTNKSKTVLPYTTVTLKTAKEKKFVSGTITNEEGRFSITGIKPDNYYLETSVSGYSPYTQSVFIGSLSEFLDIPSIELEQIKDDKETKIEEVVLTSSKKNEISNQLDKKTYSVADNISQSGGSILQSMQNLPGVTVQDGKVQLRGNDKVTVLIDGKQTALTGFGSQSGLDNIPASAIDKIEIINNPSSKYDANGNAGIINIIMKKNKQNGWNGKIGFTYGTGSFWIRKENLPTIRPQYTITPKINPSLSLNYRKDKINVFLQVDNLYTQTLNKNEFVTRTYDNGNIINSQLKRNRNTNYLTTKAGFDWNIDSQNTLTISGLYGSEKIIDRGDQPFFNGDFSQRQRLWQFLEDELKTTVMGTASYQHKFKEAGHVLNVGFNYTFHREDEKYFYDNYLPTSTGTDAFKLLSDEQVYDFNVDYIKPLKYGRIETGIKLRNRSIPTNMNFIPGANSVLDVNAGGWANYKELIPAVYGNYVFENAKWEAELGLRLEYVKIQYDVNPNHPTYKSDSYNYTQPFPNLRLAYKLNDHNKLSIFYNRRVDRPNEVDIRIFPKYDDAEIIKVGNPGLRPQFTNSIELGHKYNWNNGYLYSALYHRFANGTITRVSSIVPESTLIYAVFQNAGRSYNSGLEMIWNQKVSKIYSFNINGNIYRNQIDAFSVENLYPQPVFFSADKQTAVSGNVKFNNTFRFSNGFDAQLTAIYLAPDIIPQGKIKSRFSIDLGMKKSVQNGKGEIFLNATDLLNTMVIKKQIQGSGFKYTSDDYYETQVIRLGYSYKF